MTMNKTAVINLVIVGTVVVGVGIALIWYKNHVAQANAAAAVPPAAK